MGLSGRVAGGFQRGLAEEMARQTLELERARQAQLQQAEFEEQKRRNVAQETRQAKLDASAEEERAEVKRIRGLQMRGRQNMAGVVGMGLDPETTRRELAFTALNNDSDIPGGVMEAIEPPKPEPLTTKTVNVGGRPVIRGLSRADLESGSFEEYREPDKPAQGPQGSVQWVIGPDGKKAYRVPREGDAPYDEVADRQEKRTDQPSNYAIDAANRIVAKVDSILPRVSNMTAGVLGSTLAKAPFNTEARDLAADIESLTASIGFDELQKMRAASPTGGALGQISDRENALLANVVASVRQDQSPANLKRNLQIVRESAARIQAAAQKDASMSSRIGDVRPMTSRGSAPAPANNDPLGIRRPQ
jgi:hypothetical protein